MQGGLPIHNTANSSMSSMPAMEAAALLSTLPMPPPPPPPLAQAQQVPERTAQLVTMPLLTEAQASAMTLPMLPPPPPVQAALPVLPTAATSALPLMALSPPASAPAPPAPPAAAPPPPVVAPPPPAPPQALTAVAPAPAQQREPAEQEQHPPDQKSSLQDAQAASNAEVTSEQPKKPAPMGIKFLVDATEAAYIRGRDTGLVELQKKTNARIVISKEHYPGCVGLHEVRILASSSSAVLNAMLNVLGRVTEVVGKLGGGDEVEYGSARLKLIIPARAAAAIIGPGGQNVREITNQSNAKVNVDMNAIPLTAAMAEQALALGGPIPNVCSALPLVLEYLADFAPEKWFKGWIISSNAGRTIPGLILWAPKGRGKGTGKVTFANTEAQLAQIAAAQQATSVGTSPVLVVPPSIDAAALANAGVDPTALAAAVASEMPPMPAMPPLQENLLLQLLAQPPDMSAPPPFS